MVGNYDRAGLADLKLVEEDGKYYLDATYEYENKHGIYELNIPRIVLPVYTTCLPDWEIDHSTTGLYPDYLKVNLGFGELNVERDMRSNMSHRISTIQTKPRKMTLSEIEAALGYSVELVSK